MTNQVERFWKKINKTDTCWEWTACILQRGYGQFFWNGKRQYAHRVSYWIHKGEIPEGLVIDHLCRNKKCVNPDHLEAVTQRENTIRGVWPDMKGRGQGPKGPIGPLGPRKKPVLRKVLIWSCSARDEHPLLPNNVRIDKNGNKWCRICDKKRGVERSKREKAIKNPTTT